ncbi:hypothetical protein FQN60_000299 [Etheostoma spectabile]|uniref:Uncharacterized protein n=1 Tax=Etheostoma spectabile TaxID=54343 RepID=A0A5J5CZX2_9PERO|nr:hypothetical protein FQN60_000299 [Etheostoma spectabile]
MFDQWNYHKGAMSFSGFMPLFSKNMANIIRNTPQKCLYYNQKKLF